jgi:hypothetical protein
MVATVNAISVYLHIIAHANDYPTPASSSPPIQTFQKHKEKQYSDLQESLAFPASQPKIHKSPTRINFDVAFQPYGSPPASPSATAK